MTSTQTFMK